MGRREAGRSMYRLLVMNPGSTTTRLAVYEDEEERYGVLLEHPKDALDALGGVLAQLPARYSAIEEALADAGLLDVLYDAVVGRGGMFRPVPSGTYAVNAAMLEDAADMRSREHAANLGAPLAARFARRYGVPAYVVDPVSVDEFEPLARISGLPTIERRSLSHALNLKAAARLAAGVLKRPYTDLNLVVAHLGGGISVTAHRQGRMIDANQALDGTGPFSPERAGGLPVGDVMRMAYSGQYSYAEMFALVTRHGGLQAHLGTNDAREVERRIARGDAHARLIYEAMAYQIAKEIGLMATVLYGRVDAIVLTGGLAHSGLLVGWIRERVAWIAPVLAFPGENEMLTLAQGGLRVLRGEEEARDYAPSTCAASA